ncbi:hypothetical protein, partial [Escherichia coli]|uniref:hypothetical protein n=1 Tax=Escherichia coli TaxID=562 RepID=UPI00321A959E
EHSRGAPWIQKISDSERIKEQIWKYISIEDLRNALREFSKWKSPGIDKLPVFWINVTKFMKD